MRTKRSEMGNAARCPRAAAVRRRRIVDVSAARGAPTVRHLALPLHVGARTGLAIDVSGTLSWSASQGIDRLIPARRLHAIPLAHVEQFADGSPCVPGEGGLTGRVADRLHRKARFWAEAPAAVGYCPRNQPGCP